MVSSVAIKLLLFYPCDVNSIDNRTGKTPLMIPADTKEASIITLLLNNDCDVHLGSSKGRTALMLGVADRLPCKSLGYPHPKISHGLRERQGFIFNLNFCSATDQLRILLQHDSYKSGAGCWPDRSLNIVIAHPE